MPMAPVATHEGALTFQRTRMSIGSRPRTCAPRANPATRLSGKQSQPLELVRDWLRSLPDDLRTIIGDDIKTVQLGWPIGLPLVRYLAACGTLVRRPAKPPVRSIDRRFLTDGTTMGRRTVVVCPRTAEFSDRKSTRLN